MRCLFGDRGYANDRKATAGAEAAGVLWAVKAKAKLPGCPLSISQRRRNRRFGKNPHAKGRARVPGDEMPIRLSHRFAIDGIAKNGAPGLRAARARQPIPCPQDTRVRMKNTGGESLPAEGRNYAGTSINNENPAPPSTHREKVTLLRGSLSRRPGKRCSK